MNPSQLAHQQAEIANIVAKYDRWRDRLLKLRAGASPGSLGLRNAPTAPPR